MFKPHPYEPRRVISRPPLLEGGWRIKRYMVVYGDLAPEWERFEVGIEAAQKQGLWLPQLAVTASRPGLAFIIGHQGRCSDYLVLKWWDNENELPGRVLIHDRHCGNSEWRPAGESEDMCVWDLAVIWFERNAYIDTVLSGSAEAYLDRTYQGTA